MSSIQQRTARVADRVEARPRPRVAVLEWTDPPFAPGHWIPEMVWLVGGDPVIGVAGAASRRTDDVEPRSPMWWWLRRAATTGRGTTALARDLASRGVLPPGFGSWRWMRTRRGRGRATGWSTVLRSSPTSSTRRPTRPWPSVKRQVLRRAPPPASHLVGRIRRWDPQPADGVPPAGWLLSHCSARCREAPRARHPDNFLQLRQGQLTQAAGPHEHRRMPVEVARGEERCRLVLDKRLPRPRLQPRTR